MGRGNWDGSNCREGSLEGNGGSTREGKVGKKGKGGGLGFQMTIFPCIFLFGGGDKSCGTKFFFLVVQTFLVPIQFRHGRCGIEPKTEIGKGEMGGLGYDMFKESPFFLRERGEERMVSE